MGQVERTVYAGVETHLDVHVAAVVDGHGALLGTRQFPTTPLGLRGLQRWLESHGNLAAIGVEGTGSYGAGLSRLLRRAGHRVVEVNRPDRQARRSQGKSDSTDARAAALAVVSGRASSVPKSGDGIVESIRVLRVASRSSRRQMSRIEGQVAQLIVNAPERLRIKLVGRHSF